MDDFRQTTPNISIADEIAAAELQVARGEGMEHDEALRVVTERLRRVSPDPGSEPC